MPVAAPDEVVASHLATALSMTLDTDVRRGPVVPAGGGVPDEAIFCLATGGPAPERGFDNMAAREDYKPLVQVWVRSAVNDYAGGVTLARDAQKALHGASLAGYASCRAQQSEPIYLQTDGTGHHEFTVIVQLWRVG